MKLYELTIIFGGIGGVSSRNHSLFLTFSHRSGVR